MSKSDFIRRARGSFSTSLCMLLTSTVFPTTVRTSKAGKTRFDTISASTIASSKCREIRARQRARQRAKRSTRRQVKMAKEAIGCLIRVQVTCSTLETIDVVVRDVSGTPKCFWAHSFIRTFRRHSTSIRSWFNVHIMPPHSWASRRRIRWWR